MKHKNIPIGSLITTYYKGYFILCRIEVREDAGDLYYFVQVATEDGKPVKSLKQKTCDERFCNRVSPDLVFSTELKQITKKYELLKQYA